VSTPNPYAPPQAALKDAPPAAGSAVKAVVLGLLTDVGGTLAAVVLIMFVYGIVLGASGVRQEEIAAAVNVDFASTDSGWFYVGAAIGLGFSVLGGYVCARIARRSEMKLGAIMALLSAGLGLAMGSDQMQLGTNLSMTLATLIAVMAGARFGQKKNQGTK
jgi:hypothetical protein